MLFARLLTVVKRALRCTAVQRYGGSAANPTGHRRTSAMPQCGSVHSLVQAKAALARSGQRTTEMLEGLDVAFVRNAKAALQWVPADGGATPLAELVCEYFRCALAPPSRALIPRTPTCKYSLPPV